MTKQPWGRSREMPMLIIPDRETFAKILKDGFFLVHDYVHLVYLENEDTWLHVNRLRELFDYPGRQDAGLSADYV